MKWDSRVSALERRARDEARAADVDERLAELHAAADRRLDETLACIPGPLRPSVTEALRAGGPNAESLQEWLGDPFVPHSPPVSPDFRFPVALIEFLLRPPREYWLGHSCQACGLRVPVFLTWQNDPDPPPSVRTFPVCPACGGVTGYS